MHSSYVDVEIWEADNRFGEIIGRFPLQKFRIDADSVRNGKWNINRWTINAPYRFKGTSQIDFIIMKIPEYTQIYTNQTTRIYSNII